MIKNENLLLTGATGIFGRYILKELIKKPIKLTLLVRAENDQDALLRIQKIVGFDNFENITVLSADLSKTNLGLSEKQYKDTLLKTTSVLHAAAPTRFDLSLDEARMNILNTTKNIVEFALQAKNIKKFGYVSSAYTAGKHTGLITESKFSNNGFINSYDQSKFEAESYVLSQKSKLPISIYRPGLIVSPDCGNHNAAIVVLKLIEKSLLPLLPGLSEDLIDILSANEASKAICDLFNNYYKKDQIFHITAGDKAPKIKDIIAIVNAKKIIFTGHNENDYKIAVSELTDKHPSLKPIYEKMDCVLRYLLYPKIFNNSKTVTTLNKSLGQEDVLLIMKDYLEKE